MGFPASGQGLACKPAELPPAYINLISARTTCDINLAYIFRTLVKSEGEA